MNINSKTDSEVTANNNKIEEINDFVYLGSKITANGDSTMDIQYRVTKARANFENLRIIWKSPSLRTQTEIRILKTNIIGLLLYGTEFWKVTNGITQTKISFKQDASIEFSR